MQSNLFRIGAAVLVVAALVIVGVTVWTGRDGGAPTAAADPTDPQQVALGKEVYNAYCASCHGADLAGEPDWRVRKPSGALPAPPHDATGHTWHHPDRQLFDITKHGIAPFAPDGYVTDMPGFGDQLSDAQIWAVLAYIKSRWPADIRAQHAERSAAAGG